MERKFKRLLGLRILTLQGLIEAAAEAGSAGKQVEEVLIGKLKIPKHEVLLSLSEFYNLPFMEFDENSAVPRGLLCILDFGRLKEDRWCPLGIDDGVAEVAACQPDAPGLAEEIKKTLGVERISFHIALYSDLVRIIENSWDINPRFQPSGGRTPLAKVRTFLANRRSLYACYRTQYARGRTGLAFLRTGFSFIAIGLLLFRVFGIGLAALGGSLLVLAGLVGAWDGFKWYLPTRKIGHKRIDFTPTRSTWGTTVLEASGENAPSFTRSAPIEGAEELRVGWKDLSPVMRRRFLASDRTDMAEERTKLAYYRTIMAKARTGLAFTRTGFAFVGLGVTLIRQFKAGPWMSLDISLLAIGVLMALEGLYWYFPGRGAGNLGKVSVDSSWEMKSIWDIFFPPALHEMNVPMSPGGSPGIWATTGLALERTVLADRRNIMARIRTVMARSRTGMALVRTGVVISSIGLGLLVYFGAGNTLWTVFDSVFMLCGLAFIADGFYWHIPAEKVKRQLPFSGTDLEIALSDYGRPASEWGRAVFSHDE
ncbi:MAG: hypothetical protein WA666_10610 [Nitrospirota bacterium]